MRTWLVPVFICYLFVTGRFIYLVIDRLERTRIHVINRIHPQLNCVIPSYNTVTNIQPIGTLVTNDRPVGTSFTLAIAYYDCLNNHLTIGRTCRWSHTIVRLMVRVIAGSYNFGLAWSKMGYRATCWNYERPIVGPNEDQLRYYLKEGCATSLFLSYVVATLIVRMYDRWSHQSSSCKVIWSTVARTILEDRWSANLYYD
jgi:hypothetical protein